MPVEGPEQFELNTLEALLKSIDQPKVQSSGKWSAIFGIVGIVLLVSVYFLHHENWLSAYLRYILCVLGGICVGGSAIVNRLGNQSRLCIQYLDKEAIKKRIEEIKM